MYITFLILSNRNNFFKQRGIAAFLGCLYRPGFRDVLFRPFNITFILVQVLGKLQDYYSPMENYPDKIIGCTYLALFVCILFLVYEPLSCYVYYVCKLFVLANNCNHFLMQQVSWMCLCTTGVKIVGLQGCLRYFVKTFEDFRFYTR